MRLWIYLGLTVVFSPPVAATELVHRSVNPNFGGNPLNGNFLMSQATAQDNNKESVVPDTPVNALQDFTDRLKESLLNEIANNASKDLFDQNGNLIEGNTVAIDGFSIAIGNRGADGALKINISDGISNTQLTIPKATTTTNSTTGTP